MPDFKHITFNGNSYDIRDDTKLNTSLKGAANGLAELDANGKVPSTQLPSYVDDIIDGYYYNGKFYEESTHTTEITGETGKIYIDLVSENTYRWSGSVFVEISKSLALGETSSTAYRGDRGKVAYDHATDNSRLTTAQNSGLYKIATTAEGHVASVTDVTKSDITALGIPAQDTTYSDFIGSDGVNAGVAGLVPAPAAADDGKFLKGDGTWSDLDNLPNVTSSDNGKVLEVANGEWSTGAEKANKADPVITGTLNLGRKANTTVGTNSVTLGYSDTASGTAAFAEGYNTTASGNYGSHAEGYNTIASGHYGSHAEGGTTTAGGEYSHAEGFQTMSSGAYSHAEGYGASDKGALGKADHVEGYQTKANSGSNSTYYGAHAEGNRSQAMNHAAHAEGYQTTASGMYSHSEGNTTTASGENSHAEGNGVVANNLSQHVSGEYNVADMTGTATTRGTYAEIIGNGTADNARSNARTLDWSGNERLMGNVYVGCNADGTGGSVLTPVVGMTGADGTNAGTAGYVPAPAATDDAKYLRGDGTWSGVNALPDVTASDNGKALGVIGGEWVPTDTYAPKAGPVFTESISLGRKANTTIGLNSVAVGADETASGYQAFAVGYNTTASGNQSVAEGNGTTASSAQTHAEGNGTTASGAYSHAEGYNTVASGEASHAEGGTTTASATRAHAEGDNTKATNSYSHAEGMGGTYTKNGTTYTSEAKGVADHTEGFQTRTASSMPGNHAEGYQTSATGGAAHAEGYNTLASGNSSHAEGNNTTASGMYSHAEGQGTVASNYQSHAEGYNSIASSGYAHAEGYGTKAFGEDSHAEGYNTTASGSRSHAEGTNTIARGICEHVSGSYNVADRATAWVASTPYAVGDIVSIDETYTDSSNVERTVTKIYKCKTANSDSKFTASKWDEYGKYLEVVGNGTDDASRSNARALDWSGNEYLKGDLYIGCSANSSGGTKVATLTDISSKMDASLKGTANGVAELDVNGKVPSSQLPSYVDDVIEGYYHDGHFYEESTYTTEIVGEAGKIYIDLATDKTYRWGGSTFVVIASDLALGETSSTAYRGDRGKIAYDHATDSNRLTTAQNSGLYKIATTAEGHIASVDAVLKSDITDLGIPAQDTTYSDMTGATTSSAGESGLVPAPSAGDDGKYLKGDGTWADVDALPVVTSSDNGKALGVIGGEWVPTDTFAPKNSPVFTGSISLGRASDTIGTNSFAVGSSASATGQNAHAEGENTLAQGNNSHAEGYSSDALAVCSHAEGYNTTAGGNHSHAEGNSTSASGLYSHAEGLQTTVNSSTGAAGHAEGYNTVVDANYAHAEGQSTTAANTASHAEGMGGTVTYNGTSYASGARGTADHAEGYQCLTLSAQPGNHAEGYLTKAVGGAAHSEGVQTLASGNASHAEGNGTTASGGKSHAEGGYTIANHACQHVFGQYNVGDPSTATATALGNYVEIVGNGTADNSRSNARTLDWSGNERLMGDIYVGCNADSSGGTKLTAPVNMTGATSSVAGAAGYVPAPSAGDEDKFLAGNGTWVSGGKPMVILSYGNSTWNDFINAYNSNVIVYCRASSNSNPATGSQTRMAFMAYVNNSESPTEVEFQYYRSVSSHSASQMGDQVFVYKLTSSGTWTVTTREASLKQITAGTGINVSWANNVATISGTYSAFTGADGTDAGTTGLVPAPTATDNNKYLKGDGTWASVGSSLPTAPSSDGTYFLQCTVSSGVASYSWVSIPAASGVSF